MKPLSAILIFGGPVVAILAFWLMARIDRRAAADPNLPTFVERNGLPISIFLVGAVAIWSLILIVLPQLDMVDYSFHPKLPAAARGGERDVYTLENYRYFLFGSTVATDSWNLTHLKAFWLTIVISIFITLLNFAICYPLASFLAQVGSSGQVRTLMLLLIIPYWVNEILRAFAFGIMFGTGGLINTVLIRAGIIVTPFHPPAAVTPAAARLAVHHVVRLGLQKSPPALPAA